MDTNSSLTCPKCRGTMSSYERSGVVIDQCADCRGIFLDRGELERLVDLAAGGPPAAAQPQWDGPTPDRSWRQQQPQHRDWRPPSKHDWDGDSDDYWKRGHKSKRKSFLKEFLDF